MGRSLKHATSAFFRDIHQDYRHSHPLSCNDYSKAVENSSGFNYSAFSTHTANNNKTERMGSLQATRFPSIALPELLRIPLCTNTDREELNKNGLTTSG